MNPSVLLQKLIEIEKSIGVEMESTTRQKVLEAQAYVLSMHFGPDDALPRRTPDPQPGQRLDALCRVSRRRT